ncbi:MAG: response regulator [Candidatus Omnitrophica bacterium]|nr:response regulator [Candidatus Omnitrophota bacterium]MCF7877020.1 response regulator [Candidatus Omnitrophota bacterium]MCF7878361.1 response regulator [Candidatus Omnitrophota bacterium]MCF7893035.1 response regulator [Candidatus Omnitrophota bacterium]
MAKKVLIIDDEKDFCWFVKSNLEINGEFQIITSNSGKEGLKKAKEEVPDLILLDILIPDMEGPAVAEELANCRTTRDIPIIFLTAIVREEEAERSIGGKQFIAKPVETEKLREAIRTTIF